MAKTKRSRSHGSRNLIPYGRQSIDKSDMAAVAAVLRSDWLTQGPYTEEFERALASYCGAKYAVVFTSGTAALQAAYFAADVEKGDEIITSPLTFAATANAALWFGTKPIFADINPHDGNIDPKEVVKKISSRTKAIVPIDFSGRPADLLALRKIAKKHKLLLIEDACHALGATVGKKRIGSLSDMSVFSFHPVKSITTGEGGAVTTDNPDFFEKLKLFRSHGITKEKNKFIHQGFGDWYHEMHFLGQNYRMTDIQAALGLSQLKRLPEFLRRRRGLARAYGRYLKGLSHVLLPPADPASSWHLYVIRCSGNFTGNRDKVFKKMREAGIGAQVHYLPVYWHPYYQNLGYKKGICPHAEAFAMNCISLPLFPNLKKSDQEHVVKVLRSIFNAQ